MSDAWKLIIGYLVFVNIVSLTAYGVDKYKARKSLWRIPESTLILIAYFGGALGAFLGMRLFHHKTLHTQFRIFVPAALVLWCIALGALVYITR